MNILQRVRASGCWKPSNTTYLIQSRLTRRATDLPSDDTSLRATAEWIARAQDATNDGGISGRYRLSGGWSSSYPETTGYIVPTLLALAKALGDDRYRERAAKCVDFLLSVQLPDGGFPALEVADNRTKPSPFNSAQIVHGLQQWHQQTRDVRVLDAIVRAAHWICDMQDLDGAWRRYFYKGLACTYSAHAACWLAELGAYAGEPRFQAAALQNLHWVLAHRDPATGWFDACGFSEADHAARRAYTHTIAYTLWGVLLLSERLTVREGVDAVRAAAESLMHRLERSKVMPGILNHEWRAQSSFVCLTGNAQLAILWLKLAETGGDLRYVSAAFKAIDQVKRAQSLTSAAPGIRGGIPGSWPIGGEYISYALPNWAAKFFADALLAKRAHLAGAPVALSGV
jgi:hypothetical protein